MADYVPYCAIDVTELERSITFAIDRCKRESNWGGALALTELREQIRSRKLETSDGVIELT